MAEGICTLRGCTRSGLLRRGMCEPHYRREMKYGDPNGSAQRAPRTCAVVGCPTEGQTRQGLCDTHYRRMRRNGDPGPAALLRIIGDDRARFESYVDRDGPTPIYPPGIDQCWIWTGALTAAGYGTVTVAGEAMGAHRWAWMLLVGQIPTDLELDHLCRNTSCVNPRHLEPVTTGENVRRRNYARAGKPWLSTRQHATS